jgi:hypothetical protein
MKVLLRSVIICDPAADHGKEAFNGYLRVDESGISCELTQDQLIWEFCREFCRSHGHAPELRTVRTHFLKGKDDDTLNRLEQITQLKPLYKGDLEQRIKIIADDRRVRDVIEILREAGRITQGHIEFKEGRKTRRLEGPIDAIRYITERAHDIVAPTFGSKLSGEVTSDGESFREEYLRVKSDPYAGVGQLSAIEQMDHALSGAKRHELWTHAAFTGGLKSTLILNWAYNQAVLYGNSSAIFSLEMPYAQCRRILYSIHSLNDVFRDVRVELGIQDKPLQDRGLDYKKIRDGQLADNEEEFLMEHVIPHFDGGHSVEVGGTPVPHGKIHIEVSDPDKDDFTVPDLRAKAELLYAESPFQTVFVDHVGLMAPRKWSSSTTERLNEVIRDLKRMAMGFNRGQGMAVVALFQINREGYKRAMKMKDKDTTPLYNLTDLSYANEAERSSDIVTTTWVDDDLRRAGRVLFQCLKSRDQAPFEPFYARVEWPCRRILTSHEPIPLNTGKKEMGNKVEDMVQDAALDILIGGAE